MKQIIFIGIVSMLVACGTSEPKNQKISVTGYAQGTTYSVIYLSEDGKNYQRAIDSMLIVIDNSLSTYNQNSVISKWNRRDDQTGLYFDEHFNAVYAKAYSIYEFSDGMFDPTVAPLVNAWGFGFEKGGELDSAAIDTLLDDVGFDKIKMGIDGPPFTLNNDMKLDFNAIAQGYTVDVIGELLEKKGIDNYMVEVGGEVKTKGVNAQDTLWRIGIDRPMPDLTEREIEAIVHLDNKALATSGNYRKFYEKDGKKYSHTINPKTGYPVEHNLLSVTVIMNECAEADAFATMFMVVGLEESKAILERSNGIDALLIYSDKNGSLQTFVTDRIKPFIELNPDKQ